jgi:hypothetical protein
MAPSSSPGSSAGAIGFGSAQSPAGESPPQPPPTSVPYPPPAANAPPPAATPAVDARDRQFEILNEAVSALRQEVSRSYARAEELGAENQRLRALVTSLRLDLRRSRGANKSIEDHLRTLEKKLREISSPPQESTTTETKGAASPEERAAPTPPSPQPPEVSPPQAPPQNAGDDEDGEGSAAPQDDAD